MIIKEVACTASKQFRGYAPLRLDFTGMSDFFPAFGRNINACLLGLNAELFATSREDDLIRVNAGIFGKAEMRLPDIYGQEFGSKDPMLFKAIKMYPGITLTTGFDVSIDCQYGAGGLSTSSSVAAAIHAFLRKVFDIPENQIEMVWKVIRTEPHCYGRQDQLAVVYGGVNMWEMKPEEFDTVNFIPKTFHPENIRRFPLYLCESNKTVLEESLILYESGIEAGAEEILRSVARTFNEDPREINRKFSKLNTLALDLWSVLNSYCANSKELSEAIGPIFNKIRSAHEDLHPTVTNNRMADLFEQGFKSGATGARYSGAGGRGVVLFSVPSHRRAELEANLDKVDTPGPGTTKIPVKGKIQRFAGFDPYGARCWSASF